MSRKDLSVYLSSISKKKLEIQILELYDKFKDVKVYYDFSFRPNEANLAKDAKLKISNEYFPEKRKKPKMRRSVGQKFIKHFITLGVDPFIIADVMLFNIEIAQSLTAEKKISSETFYKSMLTSYNQAVKFVIEKSILYEFQSRIFSINNETIVQKWVNTNDFSTVLEQIK
jgi:Family of unknown function (DUF6155)